MKDRLSQVVEFKCKGNIRKFSSLIDVPYTNLYTYFREDRKGSNKVTAEILAKVVLAFDDISADWLLTGRGEMIITEHNQLLEKLESAREEIGYYKGIIASKGLDVAPFRPEKK